MAGTEEIMANLQSLLRQIEGLRQSNGFSIEFKKWKHDTEKLLRKTFGESSVYFGEFTRISFGLYRAIGPTDMKRRHATYFHGLDDAQILLESIMEDKDDWEKNIEAPKSKTSEETAGNISANSCIFIGHGRRPLWARLQVFLEKELGLNTINYESESRAGKSIVTILEQMLDEANFAVLILTAEDETPLGKRARQNVVHEAGLFQGRLGFNKAILLMQNGLEEFSNVHGLQYISFTGDQIDQTFHELRRVLKREGLIE